MKSKDKTTDKILLTVEGLKKLQEELDLLKGPKRKEVIEKLKEARSFGDLSENAEYDAAREEQAKLEERIQQLENKIKNVELVEAVDENVVSMGKSILVQFLDTSEEVKLHIVSTMEIDPFNNYISNEGPVGEALMGAKEGEIVHANTPDGMLEIKLIKIL